MKRFFHTSRAALLGLSVAATAVGGCGSLDSKTNAAPVLATLQGSITNPQSVAVSGAVRVAVVWLLDGGNSPGFNVAQDLPVQPIFPSSFQIAFDGPPPAAAMITGSDATLELNLGNTQPEGGVSATGSSGSGSSGSVSGGSSSSGGGSSDDGGSSSDGGNNPNVRLARARALLARPELARTLRPLASSAAAGDLQIAIGTVVSYVDENGDGQLDLVASDASAYVDRIVAANSEELLVYIQGTIPAAAVDSAGRLPSEGYNIVEINPSCAHQYVPSPACVTAPVAQGPCDLNQWQDMSQLYTLTVSANPAVSTLMCETPDDSNSTRGTVSDPNPPSVQPAQYPSPCSPDLTCISDGSQYFFQTCTTVQNGLCNGTSSNCTIVSYMRPTPTPAGWPCAPAN